MQTTNLPLPTAGLLQLKGVQSTITANTAANPADLDKATSARYTLAILTPLITLYEDEIANGTTISDFGANIAVATSRVLPTILCLSSGRPLSGRLLSEALSLMDSASEEAINNLMHMASDAIKQKQKEALNG